MHNQTTSAEKFVAELAGKGLADKKNLNNQISQAYEKNQYTPLFVHIIIFVGATVASFMLYGLVISILKPNQSSISMMAVAGIPMIIAAMSLNKLSFPKNAQPIAGSMMISLPLMASGKILTVIGFQPGTPTEAAMFLIMASVAPFFLYHSTLDRFLTIIVSLSLITTDILFIAKGGLPRELTINLMIALQLIIIAIILARKYIEKILRPVLYALIVSVCYTIAQLTYLNSIPDDLTAGLGYQLITNLIMAGALISAILWAAREEDNTNIDAIFLACCASLLLAFISSPGIILSVILLVIGYKRNEFFLLALGAVAMASFIPMHYYSMQITLLHKSALLIASGALFLIGYAIITYNQWNKGA